MQKNNEPEILLFNEKVVEKCFIKQYSWSNKFKKNVVLTKHIFYEILHSIFKWDSISKIFFFFKCLFWGTKAFIFSITGVYTGANFSKKFQVF